MEVKLNSAIVKKVMKATDATVNQIAEYLIIGVKLRTPVKTGRLNRSWQVKASRLFKTIRLINRTPYTPFPRYYMSTDRNNRFGNPGPIPAIRASLRDLVPKIKFNLNSRFETR